MKDREQYVLGRVFGKGDGERVKFLKSDKVMVIVLGNKGQFFYRESGFVDDDKERIRHFFSAGTNELSR